MCGGCVQPDKPKIGRLKKIGSRPRSKSRQFTFEGAHPIDISVGNRIRGRRILMGISQERLGESLGITFQQVQKYEKGANRISASRLYDVSQILGVAPDYFFEEVPGVERSCQPQPAEPDTFDKRETLELVRAYYEIDDLDVRNEIGALIRSLAE